MCAARALSEAGESTTLPATSGSPNLDSIAPMPTAPLLEFLTAACVPRHGSHASGTIARANAILAEHPALATTSLHAAAVLGDSERVERFLAADPSAASRPAPPHGWDPLTYLCFSNYLKLDASRAEGFVRAAATLLDAGASANSGFAEPGHEPNPTFESVLYGACGVAHHAPLTRLLLARGAEPNDEEVPYHAPEGYDNAALVALLECGRLTPDSLSTLLLRKCDWHDAAGVLLVLAAGADPNRASRWSRSGLFHAISRDNGLALIGLLLDHGADPAARGPHGTAIAAAARCGRGDLLQEFVRRGIPLGLHGVDALVAACAEGDAARVRALRAEDPEAVAAVLSDAPRLLGRFAGIGNADGLGLLLDLGVPADLPLDPTSGYFRVARGSTALHVAAWRARHETVALLLERGASPGARDADGVSPLMWAVRACVDSYWADRRTPESVALLLSAGAPVDGVPFPSGYAEVDALLSVHRAR